MREMHRVGAIVLLAACAAFLGMGSAAAFTEPSGGPAAFSSPTLLNTGPASQTKAGDIAVENLKSSNSIGLGGVTRTSWFPGGTGCAWEGWKCDCKSDGSSFASLALTFGVKCARGRVEDAGLFGLAISSKTKSCNASAPAPCTQALYTRNNQDGGTFLESATAGLSSAGGVVAAVALAPIKAAIAVGTFAVKGAVAVASAGADIVVGGVKAAIATVGSIGSGVWDAGKEFASTVSQLALDPKANPIQIVVGTGVAAVKAVVAVGTVVVKAAVTAVVSAGTTVVKAAAKVVKALCFWC